MNIRKQVKLNARRALSGNWGKAICIFMVALSIFIIFSILQGVTALLLDIPDFQDIMATPQFYPDDIINTAPLSLALAGFFMLFGMIVNSPLSFGTRSWYYRLAEGDSEDIGAVFSFFWPARLLFKTVWHDVNVTVRLALWSLLFAAAPAAICGTAILVLRNPSYIGMARLGGILLMIVGVLLAVIAQIFFLIFSNRYILSIYLLAENPEMSVRRAIQTSIRYMKGGKGAVFVFTLSFLPWALLCALVLPLLYVAPYYSASRAIYAKYLIERGKLSEPEDETLSFNLNHYITEEVPDLPPEEQEEDTDPK